MSLNVDVLKVWSSVGQDSEVKLLRALPLSRG